MRALCTFFIMLIAVFASCSITGAQNWKKFFTNAAGYDFFYDEDSLVHIDKNSVQVWYKSVPTEEAETKAWKEWVELKEVDCTRRRYKTLQGRVIYENKPMTELKESTWIYLEPGDLHETFYKTICTRKGKLKHRDTSHIP